MSTFSVVIETFNATPESKIQLQHILNRLSEQTYPQEKIETIVVVDEANTELADFLKEKYPATKTVITKDPTYYNMKILGIKSAQSDIVALLDSDCYPGKNWAERIVSAISKADIVAGKIRYSPNQRFSRTFNLFSFGHIQNDENGEANGFNVNNVAFKKDVILKHNFDHRLRRSGGAYLLGRQLKALNYKLVYAPDTLVVHYNYGLRFQIMMRVRTGYETMNLCRLDNEGVLPETKFVKFGILAPIIFSVRRLLFDFNCIVSNRRDLDISVYAMPYFWAASFVIRAIEALAGIIAVIKPDYFAKKFGW